MSNGKVIIFLLSVLFLIQKGNALECYSCDSAEDVECATRPGQQINVEECSTENDKCVTVIAMGTTRRGCLSRLYPNAYCPEPCDRCETNLCNRNVFPSDRLRCFQCSGAACINVENRTEFVKPCPVYNEKDRCFTNVININNVIRGCEYTNLPADCPNVCLKCNYDGCNDELGVHEESCYQCRHAQLQENLSCLRGEEIDSEGHETGNCAISEVNTCQNKLLHGHKGKCFSYHNTQTDVFERGCATNMPFYPSGTVTYCDGTNCNHDCAAIRCMQCSSITNGTNCIEGKNMASVQCKDGVFSCFYCENGNVVRRGCADETFQSSDASEVCYQCNGLNCNRAVVRTCLHCSSLDDNDCGSLKSTANINRHVCTNQNDLCVSTMISKLNLVYALRGCSSDVPECTPMDPYCVRCNGSLCNNSPMEWDNQQQQRHVQIP